MPALSIRCSAVHGLIPAWHYHLIDVEAMAVGWLSAWASQPQRFVTGFAEHGSHPAEIAPNTVWTIPPPEASFGELSEVLSLPYRSDDLSRACGVEPPSEDERHTAMGDARWVQRWYDALSGVSRG